MTEQEQIPLPPLPYVVDDHENIYPHYGAIEPSSRALRIVHFTAGLVYHPRVQLADGVKEQMEEDTINDVMYVFNSNHSRLDDQNSYAAMMQHKRQLFRRFIGNTAILSKPSHFKRFGVRRLLDKLGAVPVFRPGDVPGSDEEKRIRRPIFTGAGKAMEQTIIGKMVRPNLRRLHTFIFGESTRKRVDQHEVGPIKHSIGRIACGAAAELGDGKVAILPMALYMGDSENRKWLRRWVRGNIYVGMPIPVRADDKLYDVIDKTAAGTQDALDKAVAANHERWPTLRLSLYRYASRQKNPPAQIDPS